MERPRLEVADVFRRYGSTYRQQHAGSLSRGQRRVMSAIELCRTAALGGHLEQCDFCGHQRPAYNSCRNRHCPKCQSLARAQWLEDRQGELLPVEYFHVIFTVPEEIAAIAYQNKEVVYGILFRATAETLRTTAADPKHLGAEIGFLAILHTWGQNLLFHPHLDCVVPGGGISPNGQLWIACRPNFFLHVRVLSCLFRRLFLEHLQAAFDHGQLQFFAALERLGEPRAFTQYLAPLKKVDWMVYSKPPFGGPEHVLNYLGRYTHRVAISNNRLLDIDNGKVTFSWKDYRDHERQKVMTLDADEFIRRFLLHVLPDSFQRIQHYGFLGHRYRQAKLTLCRKLLGVVRPLASAASPQDKPDYRDLYEKLTGKSLKDLARTLDYLETRPEFDSGRVAYFGLSWGASIAPIFGALEKRIKLFVLEGGGLVQGSLPEIAPVNFAPHHKAATVIFNGRYDLSFPLEASAKPLLQLLGTSAQDKALILFDGGHVPPLDSKLKKEMLGWLDRYLGKVR